MLTQDKNELLTQVGPDTPMGSLLRRYWIPALMDWELAPDGDPVKIRLLGEDLVAFRTRTGKLGVLDEYCPHRGTSLWLGRNEEEGLRCIYHGWKFDSNGQCVDQMNEPQQFASKVKASAYDATEAGGVVWVYMGPKEAKPSAPTFEWTQVPDTQRVVTKVVQQCNWLQALEGGIDTSHAPILHRQLYVGTPHPGISPANVFVAGSAPHLEVDATDYGYRYYGIRELESGDQYFRGYHFVMPWTQFRPSSTENGDVQTHGHHWVPIDDYTCIVWNWHYSPTRELSNMELDLGRNGNSFDQDIDVSNGFVAIRNRSNNWMLDRSVQRTETFSGIPGINTQDRAVQETMGPIVDRTREHLGPADKAVIAARKLLEDAIGIVADGGAAMGSSPGALETIDTILARCLGNSG